MRRFVCQCCGNCCRWDGMVRLQPDEPDKMASACGIPVEEFTDKYTDLAPDRLGLVLKCRSDGACCFLTADNLCQINSCKPRQCANFPYTWQATPEQQRLCKGHWIECAD